MEVPESKIKKNNVFDAVAWRKALYSEKPSLWPFPIKRRINTELFIDGNGNLYIVKGRISISEMLMKLATGWQQLVDTNPEQGVGIKSIKGFYDCLNLGIQEVIFGTWINSVWVKDWNEFK